MKKTLYFFIVLATFISCRSIEKLVDQGRYDEAIFLAADRLAGKKNKKTKHVRALEEAFVKINAHDLDQISSFKADDNPYYWKDVLDIIQNIERRQEKISAFLPLVSKDGYRAKFKFVRTAEIKNKALDGAAAYHYDNALQFLTDSRTTGDRFRARDAFYEFEKAGFYRRNFRQLTALMAESRERGTTHVLLQMKNVRSAKYGENWLRQTLEPGLESMPHSFWNIYHTDLNENAADVIAELSVAQVHVSPGREIVHFHNDRKKVKVGWEYVKKKDGEIKTDSLGNRIKRDVFRVVKAQVTEIFREKSVIAEMQLALVEKASRVTTGTKRFHAETHFKDVAVSFSGDRRALCDKDPRRLKDFPLPFPADKGMLHETGHTLMVQLADELSNVTL